MEQKKIGEFIAAQRKEKQMTQRQLGEALGISDKAISKWECGKGLPDISIMVPLCELLDINVNELLSGEHLTEDVYSKKAEENMMHLIQETENQKKENARGNAFQIITWIMGNILLLAFLMFTSSSQKNFPLHFYLDLPSLITVLFYTFLALFFAGYTKDFKNAFSFLHHKPESIEKLQNAITAVSFTMKSLMIVGAFSTVFYTIYLLWMADEFVDDILGWGVNLAVVLLCALYSIIGVAILLPVKGRLEKVKDRMEIERRGQK